MKAFLLAAGNGTRLRPLTNSIPKCLVPIGGVPLLTIWLDWCAEHGITEVLLNSHALHEQVRAYTDAYRGPVRITLTYEPELLGSAGTLALNRDFVKGEADFAVLYADVLTDCDFGALLAFHRSRNAAVTLGTYRVPNPTECGIIATDERGLITEFEEKPAVPKSDLAFSGIMIGTSALMNHLPDYAPADIGGTVLPRLVGQMYAIPVTGYVRDIGTLEKYQQGQQEWESIHAASR